MNLFGGPGSGKSTTRAGVFSFLKVAGVDTEEAPEWVKSKVYEKNPYVFKDQIYIFAKQRKKLKEIGDQVAVIVTDSPLPLGIIYDQSQDEQLGKLIMQEFFAFNNLNFLITRTKAYCPIGRNETEEEARECDKKIERFLEIFEIPYDIVEGNRFAAQRIGNRILEVLTREGLDTR